MPRGAGAGPAAGLDLGHEGTDCPVRQWEADELCMEPSGGPTPETLQGAGRRGRKERTP